MKFLSATLLQFLLIFVLRSAKNAGYVECAVGLYGPDRYEGLAESCLLPMDFGYCRAKIQRYYFDIRRMKCNMFYWGGCAGNDNNFKSIDECNDFCTSGGGYQEANSIVPLKRERVINNPIANDYNSNTNTNTKFIQRGSSNSKPSAPKFTTKSATTSRDNSNNNNNGTLKASAKSFNVNPTPKQNTKYPVTTADNSDDEEYDD